MLKKVMLGLLALCLVGGIVYAIYDYKANKLYRNENFAVGNGRLEATEVSLSAKLKERIVEMNVNEGDLITKNHLLVEMQTTVLRAQLAEAKGKLSQAEAMIEVKKAAIKAAEAALEQAKHVRDEAKTEYDRDKALLDKGSGTQERVDQKRTLYLKNESQVTICEADILQAQADLKSAEADKVAAKASVKTIQADIDDSYLYSPVNGRVQYRIAQRGEVVQDGGRILNLVDMDEVYLNFYLPVQAAMKLKIGDEARIVLDVSKKYPIPATITYVDPIAQFTPKTVETQAEREKLVFRVKAQINKRLVSKVKEYVKTGVPGVCWVRLNPDEDWPKELELDPETVRLMNAPAGSYEPAALAKETKSDKQDGNLHSSCVVYRVSSLKAGNGNDGPNHVVFYLCLPFGHETILEKGDDVRITLDVAKSPIPAKITKVEIKITKDETETSKDKTETSKDKTKITKDETKVEIVQKEKQEDSPEYRVECCVNAEIDMDLFNKVKELIKTDASGACWVRLDSTKAWPKELDPNTVKFENGVEDKNNTEESSSAEPQKAEPQKAEPQKAEPKKAEPKKAEPKKAEPQKAEPQKAEPQKVVLPKKEEKSKKAEKK